MVICYKVPRSSSQESFKLSWLFDAMKEGQAAEPAVEDLTKYVDGVNALLSKKNFALLSALLGSIDTKKVSNRTLVTLARSVAPARSHVPKWRAFLMEVASTLDARGKDAEKLLKGLI
jgi:hypothetical protein